MSAKIYRSPYPDLQLKDLDLPSFLFSNPFNTPLDRPAYIDALSGKQYTLGDVYQRTKSLSNGLRQTLGLKPDDVVALFSPNNIEYPVALYAIVGSGAVVAPCSAALTPLEFNAQLKTGKVRFVIAHSKLLETAQKAVKGTSVEKILVLDGSSPVNGQETCEQIASTYPQRPLHQWSASEAAEKTALICFSSGTSGPSKGVLSTHKNITSNVQQWLSFLLDTGTPEQRIKRKTAIGFLPFSHIYGLNHFLCQSPLIGTTTVVISQFDLELYLKTVEKYQPEELALVPPVALMLVKDPRVSNFNLRSVRRILSAAAPLTGELAAALEEKFKTLFGKEVFCTQAWGLTETSPLATCLPNDRMDKRGGVGCISHNMEFRFVDPETGEDASPESDGSTKGEIWLRGPNVFSGYCNNEKATADAFHVDADGSRWFRTGDIGAIDSEGFITILDRIKEMIKYKGMQVIPSELEGKLVDHPDIDDAGVVGMWADDRATELPVAFVVLRQASRSKDSKAVIEGIHSWLNSRIANHKRLRGGVFIVDEIPKSPSGKILRRQLKELLKSKAPKARL